MTVYVDQLPDSGWGRWSATEIPDDVLMKDGRGHTQRSTLIARRKAASTQQPHYTGGDEG